jgi:hypothetical protein
MPSIQWFKELDDQDVNSDAVTMEGGIQQQQVRVSN